MDGGYVDFARLYHLNQQRAFFVTRAKKHMKFLAAKSRHVDKTSGLRCDQSIRLTGQTTAKKYPGILPAGNYKEGTGWQPGFTRNSRNPERVGFSKNAHKTGIFANQTEK